MTFDEWLETHFGPWLAASRSAARFSEVDQFRESLRVAWEAAEKASAAKIARLRARVAYLEKQPHVNELRALRNLFSAACRTIHAASCGAPATLEEINDAWAEVCAAQVANRDLPIPDVVPVPVKELATLREIVRLLDEARQRYAKIPRAGAATRMGDEIDNLLCRLYEIGAHPALRSGEAGKGGAT